MMVARPGLARLHHPPAPRTPHPPAAARARRRRGRRAGIHMPGPSFSPVFAAIGSFLLFLGLVFGGPILWLGVLALVLTLLYWFARVDAPVRPGRRGDRSRRCPAVIHDGPPPGVHMPGPSFRPIVGAIGMTMLMFGLVFGGWLLIVGVLALIVTLVGWLVDAHRGVPPDRRGRLDRPPRERSRAPRPVAAAQRAGRPVRRRRPVPDRDPAARHGERRRRDAIGFAGPVRSPRRRALRRPAPVPPAPHRPATSASRHQGSSSSSRSSPRLPTSRSRSSSTNQDPGMPHNVDFQDGVGRERLAGRAIPGRRDRRVRGPGAAGRHVHVRLLRPPGHDGHRDAPVGQAATPRRPILLALAIALVTTVVVVLVAGSIRPAGRRRRSGSPAPRHRRHHPRRRAVRPRRPARPSGRHQLLGTVLRPVPRRVPAARGEAGGARATTAS